MVHSHPSDLDTGRRPKVSFGMPVYNGADTIRRAVDSLLAQTLTDIEVVISDNASEDQTESICRAYAVADPRVRYFRNESNIGQIANFNRVFELSRGGYFRWVGCNDWWSPRYAERCAAALDAHPEAVMASCFHEYHWDDGRVVYEEYHGPRVDSPHAHKRFARMLSFFRGSRYRFDPIYSLHRREILARTMLLRRILGTDFVLAAELSLHGPACHIPEKLVFQHVTPPAPADVQIKRFDPTQSSARLYFVKLCRVLVGVVWTHPMSNAARARCVGAIGAHFLLHQRRVLTTWLRGRLALRRRVRTVLVLFKQKHTPRDALTSSKTEPNPGAPSR
jgi:glycosyltransferase involved in cell wall biosynthesis